MSAKLASEGREITVMVTVVNAHQAAENRVLHLTSPAFAGARVVRFANPAAAHKAGVAGEHAAVYNSATKQVTTLILDDVRLDLEKM